jgi:hypothetical protein
LEDILMVDEMGGAWKRTEMHTKFWWESSEERYHVEDLGIDGRIMNSCGLRWSPVVGSCERGIEFSRFHKMLEGVN